ncbi:MAG: family 16 glycosylhydrolase [Micropruina sp.]|uniref:glycoside hydrolase family 16 protein n=1 Tax=Micropruina sp. TaxID=2737536 RepID=UPI0039E2971C
MRAIRNTAVALAGLVLMATALVAPAGISQAATATGKLTVAPGRAITAQFSGTKLDRRRLVSLEKSADGLTWSTLESVKMSSKGAVDFRTPATQPGQYRAVAKEFTYKVKKKKVTAAEVVSEIRQLAAPSFADEFTGSSLADTWRTREEVGYQATGRLCSAPVSANATASGGSAVLTMTKAGATEAKKVASQAKDRQKELDRAAVKKADAAVKKAESALAKAKAMKQKTAAQRKARSAAIRKADTALRRAKSARAALTPGCPNGVFHNAMVSTQGSGETVRAGTVVARVKFSQGQGAHLGIWLQAGNRQEIDVIEAYGYGRGITNVLHRLSGSTLRKDPAVAKDAYVAVKTVKSKSWWSKWHTVAATFDTGTITFFLDGVKTRQLRGMAAADYHLTMSVLSSDWETYRIKQPDVRPGAGVARSTVTRQSLPSLSVDWIRVWKKG